MGRVGRKRKAGKRTKSGALARVPMRDMGCEGVQRRRALYAAPAIMAKDASGKLQQVRPADGSQTFDAIGRAWSAGLLGYRADELRDGARKIAAQYWRHYGFNTPDSLARFQPAYASDILESGLDAIIEGALNAGLDAVRARGHSVRRAFDQLVIDMHPDCGPDWLDRAIMAKRAGVSLGERDADMLRLALEGLREVA